MQQLVLLTKVISKLKIYILLNPPKRTFGRVASVQRREQLLETAHHGLVVPENVRCYRVEKQLVISLYLLENVWRI